MPFISVAPCMRTPFGVDVFDYAVAENAVIQPGDFLFVPFRKRQIPAVVIRCSSTSTIGNRALELGAPRVLRSYGSAFPELLTRTARRTFTSIPTVLTAWFRYIPKRINPSSTFHLQPSSSANHTSIPTHRVIATSARRETTVREARAASGRVLILTPWQKRADDLAARIGCPALHAGIAHAAAWHLAHGFLDGAHPLVTTRLGAWLAHAADTIILEEPENDDYKQDEMSPRFDSRWIVDVCRELHPSTSSLFITSTPRLCDNEHAADAPTIDVDLHTEAWAWKGASRVDGLSQLSLEHIREIDQEGKPVIVIHPVHGERARITCRDCAWTATCPSCEFHLTRDATIARCTRCGTRVDLPVTCPSCGGADLSKARAGRERVLKQLENDIGKRIPVLELSAWETTPLAPGTCVVVTDMSLIGGFTEDIRRRERLLIAWRRMASRVASVGGSILVQGPEELVSHAHAWLTSSGVRDTWMAEWQDRLTFGYPPAVPFAKLIFKGTSEEADAFAQRLVGEIPPDWKTRGPFRVLFQPRSRQERHIIHVLPPQSTTEGALFECLSPFARDVIIDLDPVAFFG